MKKTFALITAIALSLAVKGQSAPPTTQPFGKIDKSDLELKSCDFENEANAMVLFDKGDVSFDANYSIVYTRHQRIKIFDAKAKHEGNIRIEYFSINRMQEVAGLQAQTINLNNGNVEFTKVDKKQIYTQAVDKYRSAIVFSFPNVQPGSVLEIKLSITIHNIGAFPDWYFQSHLPTRYSEFKSVIPPILYYKQQEVKSQPYAVNKSDGSGTDTKAIANIPSIPDEPYMTSREDNAERLIFQLQSASFRNFSETWGKVGASLMNTELIGGQLEKRLAGEKAIIDKAKAMKTDAQKIAYLFGEVKNTMKWNEIYDKYSYEGIGKAWENKAGTSGDINLILCNLLKKAGVNVLPIATGTRGSGKVNPLFPSPYKLNNLLAYVAVDSTKVYVLDASNKYNLYDQVPANALNTFGLLMDKDAESYDIKFLENDKPVRQVVMVSAEIGANNKIGGNANLLNYSYKKVSAVELYKKEGEKKFIEYLRANDNTLKISSLKMEDMDVDSLPLKQVIDFEQELSASDGNYIYFNPNIIGVAKTSPFLSKNRSTDIDLGFRNNFILIGTYKIPAGYKVETLPQNTNLSLPDASITFRRIVSEQDGIVAVRYVVDTKKTIFFKEDYSDFQAFYKKMYEMMNEQVVLKKS